MANYKITQLPSASIATGSNVLPIVQAGVTDQITVTNLGQGILNLGLDAIFSSVTASTLLKTNLINNVSAGQQITIDPDGDNSIYIKLDGFDDGGERLSFSNTFAGSAGIYFYTEGSNTFRLYQNSLIFPDTTAQTTAYPGSSSFVAASSYGHYGNFYSTQSQYNPTASVSQSLFIETDAGSHGVTVVSGSRLTVQNTGVYNLQFSTQFQKSDNGVDTVYVWFKKNGTNIADSATAFDLVKQAGGGGKGVAAWNFVTPLTASDYLEIVWESTDTTISASYLPASGNIPAIPSTIVTLTQIA